MFDLKSADLWDEVAKNMFCTNHISLTNVSRQLECQRQCELADECVGISYSHKAENTHYCFVCKDFNLTIATNDFGFYGKPGNSQLHTCIKEE